jgi:glycosyltransferase involved in cell wall biosynthesis
MNTTGISIIIPCYKVGTYLNECVDSILLQPFRHPFEIIVVDDGSSDIPTIKTLERIMTLPNVKVIRKLKNEGAQKTRNIGLQSAIYDFIFTIDADDCLNTDRKVLRNGTYADQAVDILKSNPNVVFVHGMTCMFGAYTGLTISSYPVTEGLILKKHHAQNSIVYRKREAIEMGLYCEEIKKWQDWSFAVGLLNHRFISGEKRDIKFLAAPYYLYRIYDDANRISAHNVNEKDMIRITLKQYPAIFKKYYPGMESEDVVNAVHANKPDKLRDILYMAKDNISRALQLVERRGFGITSTKELENIP